MKKKRILAGVLSLIIAFMLVVPVNAKSITIKKELYKLGELKIYGAITDRTTNVDTIRFFNPNKQPYKLPHSCKLFVTANNKTIATRSLTHTTGTRGRFININIPKQKPGTILKFYYTWGAGNKSKVVTKKVAAFNKIAPERLTRMLPIPEIDTSVSIPKANTIRVKAPKGSTVVVKTHNQTLFKKKMVTSEFIDVKVPKNLPKYSSIYAYTVNGKTRSDIVESFYHWQTIFPT